MDKLERVCVTREHEEALQGHVQVAHVAAPVEGAQMRQACVQYWLGPPLAAQELRNEESEVLEALAQRRDLDGVARQVSRPTGV